MKTIISFRDGSEVELDQILVQAIINYRQETLLAKYLTESNVEENLAVRKIDLDREVTSFSKIKFIYLGQHICDIITELPTNKVENFLTDLYFIGSYQLRVS